jgi:hypothetical protein
MQCRRRDVQCDRVGMGFAVMGVQSNMPLERARIDFDGSRGVLAVMVLEKNKKAAF